MSQPERTRIDEPNALPPGTRFGELEILRTLGVGGFGIVYLARDHALDRDVAIKEYMPSQFAQRDGQSHVSVRSQSMLETFEIGRRSFVNEARLLARFDHPSLLKVHRFWEANGTAYMAMPFLQGRNLREARKEQPTPPAEAWLRSVIDPVLGGLACLHAQNVWHRDVAPDNIFLPADGSPAILLDFGAARQAIGDRTQAFTAILKPNYAPIEQYAEAQTLRQGAWTDIYALAAVIHTLICGKPPPPATTRALHDDYQNPEAEGYSAGLLAGLEWGLRVAPQERPQSVAEWREVLDGRKPAPARSGAPLRPKPPQEDFEATVVVPNPAAAPARPPAAAPVPTPQPAPAAKAAPAGKSRLPLLLAGVAGVVVIGGAAWMFGRPKAEPDLPASAQPASAAVTAPASSPSLASPPPASAPVIAQPPAPAPSPVAAPAPTPSVPASAARRPDAASAAAKPATKPSVPGAGKPSEPANRPTPSPVIAVPTPTTASPTVSNPPAYNNAAPSNKPAAAEPAAPAMPRTPREACGKRVFLAMALCIDEQCQKPEYRNQDECVKLREIRERQRGNNP